MSPATGPNGESSAAIPLRMPSLADTLTIEKSRGATKRKASQEWHGDVAYLSAAELDSKRRHVSTAITNVKRDIKRNPCMGHDFWSREIKLAELHQLKLQVESQHNLEHNSTPDKESELHDKYKNWRQLHNYLTKHAKKLQDRLSSGREAFVRLFATSNCGWDISGAVGKRDSHVQKNFGDEMAKVYCPNPETPGNRWDPILRKWGHSSLFHAAHLYPWKQHLFMDEIFGPGSIDELFAPCNGLFLHEEIKRALDLGHIAIVPDVDLDPSDPKCLLGDVKQRQDRIKAWEQQAVKEYKLVALNLSNPAVHKKVFTRADDGVLTLAELHGRKLQFLTDFRPRARYVWWTYLNTILRTSWQNNEKVQKDEVKKCTRYWGTRKAYVKRNQLIGFVEEIGHDAESILGDELGDDDKTRDEPGLELVTGLVMDAVSKSIEAEDGDDEEEDIGPEPDEE